MSVYASQIINPTTSCEVDVHLDNEQREPVIMRVKLGYYRSRFTKNYFKELEAVIQLDEEDEGKRRLDALIMRMIGWWNVLQAPGGAPIPLEPEALFPVDAFFEWELLRGISQHFHETIPGEAPRGNGKPALSNGTSKHAAQTTSSRRK